MRLWSLPTPLANANVINSKVLYLMHMCKMNRSLLGPPYLELPFNLVHPRLGLDPTLKVDVVVLLDVGRVQGGTELERHPR